MSRATFCAVVSTLVYLAAIWVLTYLLWRSLP